MRRKLEIAVSRYKIAKVYKATISCEGALLHLDHCATNSEALTSINRWLKQNNCYRSTDGNIYCNTKASLLMDNDSLSLEQYDRQWVKKRAV